MSKIELLAMSGVRSFHPDKAQVIDFRSPVTMIIGNNGCGKTTILEALRMAISGIMPPNSSNGRSFITDPKMINRVETKCCIKLQFKSISNQEIIATKNLTLSLASGKEECKKVEQALKFKHEEGNWSTIPYSVSQIDKQLTELLGVSKSVIENVILCHQEDSLWPFSENQTLKNVFDELFDTAKISKMSENLKRSIKERKATLKDQRMMMEVSKGSYERHYLLVEEFAVNLKKSTQLLEEIKESESKIENDEDLSSIGPLQRNIGAAEVHIENLTKTLQQYNDEVALMKPKSRMLIFQRLNNKEITFFDGEAVEHFLRETQITLDNLKEEYNNDENETFIDDQEFHSTSTIRANINFENKLELCKINITHLSSVIKKMTVETNDKLDDVIENLRQKNTRTLIQEIKGLIERTFLSAIDNISFSNPETLEKEKEVVIKCQKKSEERLNSVYANISNIDQIQKQKEIALKEKLLLLNNRIEAFKRKENAHEIMTLKNNLSIEKEKLEMTITKRDILREEITKTSDILEELRNEISMCKKAITSKKYREYEHIREIIFKKLAMSNSEILTSLQITEKTNNMESELRIADEKKADIKALISLETANKKKKEESIESLSRRIEEFRIFFKNHNVRVDVNNPYDSYKKMKDQLNDEKNKTNLTRHYLEEFLPEILEDSIISGRCFVCDRSIPPELIPHIESSFHPKVEKKKRCMNESEEGLQIDLARFELLNKYKKEIKEFQHCLEESRSHENDINESSLKICNFVYEQKKIEEDVKVLSEKLQEMRNLQNIYIKLESIDMNEVSFDINCDNIKDEAAVRIMNAQEQNINKKLSNEQTTIKGYEGIITSLTDKIYLLEIKIRDISGLEVDDNMGEDNFNHNTKEEVIELIKVTKSEIDQLPYKIESENFALNKEKNDLLKAISNMTSLIEKISGLSTIISNNPFPDLKKKLESRLISLLALDEFSRKVNSFINASIERFKIQHSLEKSKDDKQKLLLAESRIADKKRMYDDIIKTINEKKGKVNLINSLISEQLPKMQKSASTELELSKLMTQCEFNRLLIEDMEVIQKSLDSALVQFHTEKINEINKIIHNIWKETYQGNDIDTIRIVSECIDDTSNKVNKKNYNYQIILETKDHRKMVMKGRCSAGQRLLASIVIRLALSEAFCLNCGFLALDEPTTYLDEHNIEHLAIFLKKLMKSREHYQNFQLVVITHDTHFLELLSSKITHYFKISKNLDGFSQIEKMIVEDH